MSSKIFKNSYEKLTKKVLAQAQAENYARTLESFFAILIEIDCEQKSNNKIDETQNN